MPTDAKDKSYDYIIWDWNGTLFNDIDASLRSMNSQLEKHSLPGLTLKRYYEIFEFPVINYYRKLGFDFNKTSYEKLAVDYIDRFKLESLSAPLHRGAEEALNIVADKGIKQIILSACEKNMLKEKLQKFGIEKYFTDVLALDDIYAKTKLFLAEKWKNSVPPNSRFLLVGDTVHDIEAAGILGADILLFSKGHGKKENLLDAGFPVIDYLPQIADYL